MIRTLIFQSQIDIIDAIHNGILIINKEGNIVKCNKTGREINAH